MNNDTADALGRVLVLNDVIAERRRQDQKWGGPAHDDTHPVGDWVGFITAHARDAEAMAAKGLTPAARQSLIEVAALAVAAVESIDRRLLEWRQE